VHDTRPFEQRAREQAAGRADLVAFGRPFIANPDLPRRLRDRAALAVPDPATFYTPGERGYDDYPERLPEAAEAAFPC